MASKTNSPFLKALIGGILFVSISSSGLMANAFQNGTPIAPVILEIQSVKASAGTFDLKITLSVHQGNSELRPLSTVVTAAGKICTIPGGKQLCLIKKFKKGSKIVASAVTKNKNGTSAKSPSVSYTVGGPKQTYKVTSSTTTSTTPQSDGGYVGGYSVSTSDHWWVYRQ